MTRFSCAPFTPQQSRFRFPHALLRDGTEHRLFKYMAQANIYYPLGPLYWHWNSWALSDDGVVQFVLASEALFQQSWLS